MWNQKSLQDDSKTKENARNDSRPYSREREREEGKKDDDACILVRERGMIKT